MFAIMRALFAGNLYLEWCAVIGRELTEVFLMRVLIVVFVVVFAAGCASLNPPVGNIKKMCIASDWDESSGEIETAVIGSLFGRFDSFESRDIDDVFSIYSGCTTEQSSLPAVDDFSRAMSGRATIEIQLINLVIVSGHRMIIALVPRDVLESDDFSENLPGGLDWKRQSCRGAIDARSCFCR